MSYKEGVRNSEKVFIGPGEGFGCPGEGFQSAAVGKCLFREGISRGA